MLLFDKTVQLVNRVIQFAKAVTKFATSDYWLESLHGIVVAWRAFSKRANELRRVNKPYRPSNVFTNVLPKLVYASGDVFGLFNFELVVFQSFFNLVDRAVIHINIVVLFNDFGVVPLFPLFF